MFNFRNFINKDKFIPNKTNSAPEKFLETAHRIITEMAWGEPATSKQLWGFQNKTGVRPQDGLMQSQEFGAAMDAAYSGDKEEAIRLLNKIQGTNISPFRDSPQQSQGRQPQQPQQHIPYNS